MLPEISVDQMIEIDRLMVEEFHIPLLSMMDAAGAALARLALDLHHPKRVTILAGKGNNGGGGMAAARHLDAGDVKVTVVTSSPLAEMKDAPRHQLRLLEGHGVSVLQDIDQDTDLFIDALLGYSARGAPRGKAAELIRKANHSGKPVLCLDYPSGLDPLTGLWHEPSFKENDVMTLALPKMHLLGNPDIARLFLGDIGVPLKLYEQMGLVVDNPFSSLDSATSPEGALAGRFVRLDG
ncbi:MAG: NAD(P)H-hydrate epimerase [DPANN group archaeon]|nr:NAD(P)H-hydrate epimerase [DPANN group archaeon]